MRSSKTNDLSTSQRYPAPPHPTTPTVPQAWYCCLVPPHPATYGRRKQFQLRVPVFPSRHERCLPSSCNFFQVFVSRRKRRTSSFSRHTKKKTTREETKKRQAGKADTKLTHTHHAATQHEMKRNETRQNEPNRNRTSRTAT